MLLTGSTAETSTYLDVWFATIGTRRFPVPSAVRERKEYGMLLALSPKSGGLTPGNLPGIDQPNPPPKARPRLPIWQSILGRFSVP